MVAAIQFLLISFCLLVIWRIAHPHWDLHIVVRNGVVEFRRGVALNQRHGWEHFLLQEAKLTGKVQIFVKRDRSGRIRLKCRGTIDPGKQQQIRNFLLYAK